MKSRWPIIFIIFFLLTASLFSLQKIKEKDLPEKYREWLKLTRYIILPQEKEVFMQLSADRDRDIFIETFWKQRDPTPGTPQNEYKDEHIKRFLYANKYLGRGTPREGWMTDMGRIHIILGPSASTERFEGTQGIYPCQVWYYYGDKTKGLPTYFSIVFFQREGFGEFKLYNQTSDGPLSLIIEKEGLDYSNYQQQYEKIRELAPTLANVSLSMIPGQYPYNYRPSPQNSIILAAIFESPIKNISPSYATHFLDYKGVVSTEYLTNYVESEAQIAWTQDPILGINFLHFSIVPISVSVDYFEPKDQYYCNFKLSVSVRKEESIIYQYSKDFPFYFSPDNVDNIRGNGISIQDSFPIISGKYELNILLQNSVGKEFSIFEKDIVIPEESKAPIIIGPALGYKLQSYITPFRVPFKAAENKLLVDPKNTFSSTEDVAFFINITNITENLWNEGEVRVLIEGLRKQNPFQKSFSLGLKNYPYNRILSVTHSFSAIELSPDYYKMKLTLINEKGEILDEKSADFIVSPVEAIPHPVILAKSVPLSNSFLYFYSLAYQYDKVKEYEKAEVSYNKALGLKPDYRNGLIEYANFLIKVKKFTKGLELIESVKDDESLKFDYYMIKGRAYTGLEKYAEAIDNLLEGNKIYNSDTRLLNSLGLCYYKTHQKAKSLEVLKASLRLNPEQEKIKKLIEEIEKSID
ncbi:MAG: GWxTD domain-containing protein [bacterium]